MSLIIKKSICILRTHMPCPRSRRQFSNLACLDSEKFAQRNFPTCFTSVAPHIAGKSYRSWEQTICQARRIYLHDIRSFSRTSSCLLDYQDEAQVSGLESPGTVAQCVSMLTKTFTIHGVSEEEASAMYIVAHALGHKTVNIFIYEVWFSRPRYCVCWTAFKYLLWLKVFDWSRILDSSIKNGILNVAGFGQNCSDMHILEVYRG